MIREDIDKICSEEREASAEALLNTRSGNQAANIIYYYGMNQI